MSNEWDEVHEEDSAEEVLAELIPFDADEEDLSDAVAIINAPLTEEEARELTDHIRSVADALYVLIARAHAGRAWEALGYNTFAEYVNKEFDISRSRAYQLLDQAKVIAEITAAAPDGTKINVTEASARDLKHVINELVPDIIDSTEDADPDKATEIIAELLEDYRHKDQDEDGDGDDDGDGDGDDDYSGSGSGSGYRNDDEEEDTDFSDIEHLLDSNSDDLRVRIESTYSLFTSLNALRNMPEPAQILEWIQESRRPQIAAFLPAAQEWLNSFSEAWNEQPWAAEVQSAYEEQEEEPDQFNVEEGDDNTFGEFE